MYNSGFDDDGMKSEEEFIFKEYTVDDTLSSIARLKKYRGSDFHLQRLNLVRGLYDTALEIGIEKCYEEDLTDIIQQFLNDPEQSVRKELAEQLYPIAIFYLENGNYDQGYGTLIETFIPFVFELVIDKKIEVSEFATEALVKIAKLVHSDNVESELFSTIRNLAHSNGHHRAGSSKLEEHRIAAAKLLNELAPIFGEKLCCEQVVPELVRLSRDPSLTVRKAVASNLFNICPIVGRRITITRILPFYLDLCHDDIWGVRKACIESLIVISEHVTQNERTTHLTELFKNFCTDSSRWVKIEMFRQLGKFISTFREDETSDDDKEEKEGENVNKVPSIEEIKKINKRTAGSKINIKEHIHLQKRIKEELEAEKIEASKIKEEVIPPVLINYFNDMAFQSEQSDTDLVEFCAFNFPAVLKALVRSKGKEGWKYVEKSYKYLVKDMQWKVRKTLSWSLTTIAEILLLEDENEEKKKQNSKEEEEKKGKKNAEEDENDMFNFNFDEQSKFLDSYTPIDDLERDRFLENFDYHIIRKNLKKKRSKRESSSSSSSSNMSSSSKKEKTEEEKKKEEIINKEGKHDKDEELIRMTEFNDSKGVKKRKSTTRIRRNKGGSSATGGDPNNNDGTESDGLRPNELVLIQSAHSFLRDIDDVKLGVVANISKFMKIIAENRRVEFLGVILQILKDVENWRIKKKIAEQLNIFLEIFNDKQRRSHQRARGKVIRTYQMLMKDDFAIIRDSTASVTGPILNLLIRCGDEENYKDCMIFICDLVNGNWINRMLYISVCKYLVRGISNDIFETNFLGLLLKLASYDDCVNVKILASKVLSEHIIQSEHWKNDHRVVKVLNRLKDHEDPDVRLAANQTVVTHNSAMQNYNLTQLILEKERKKNNIINNNSGRSDSNYED